VPRIDRKLRAFVPIKGEIPSPLSSPSSCHLHPRCLRAMPRCSTEYRCCANRAGALVGVPFE
jgi:peptide/nickel transport system ATP-binding protein